MKKVFTLLMAMMIVGLSFAQVSRSEARIPDGKKAINKEMVSPVLIKSPKADPAKTASSFWYDYGQALANFYSVEELEWDWYPLCGDTVTYYPWSGSDPSALPYMTIGRAFDWANEWWNNFYYNQAAYSNVPALWATDSYTIDSVGIWLNYSHADSVSEDRVDTLIVAYVMNLDNMATRNSSEFDSTTFQTLNYGEYFTWLPVDPVTSLPAYNNTMGDTLPADAQVVIQKVPLTIQDTVPGFALFTIESPAELQNLSCNRFAVFYTFRPGTNGEHSEFWSTCNAFHWFYWVEPREEYNHGGEQPYGDLNWDYKIDRRYSLNQAHSLYSVALPEMFYAPTDPTAEVKHDLTGINIHATCNNCAIVNVPEIEDAIATIYPNPASTEINVITNTNEKVNVEMFNLVGQKVYSEQVVNSTKINVSNMKAGVYMLRVNNHTTKVVVK